MKHSELIYNTARNLTFLLTTSFIVEMLGLFSTSLHMNMWYFLAIVIMANLAVVWKNIGDLENLSYSLKATGGILLVMYALKLNLDLLEYTQNTVLLVSSLSIISVSVLADRRIDGFFYLVKEEALDLFLKLKEFLNSLTE